MPELLTVFLAVMIADIILLDLFNTYGLPTSTTGKSSRPSTSHTACGTPVLIRWSVRFSPPLTITAAQADAALEIFASALAAVENGT